jgi:hypothetical protein
LPPERRELARESAEKVQNVRADSSAVCDWSCLRQRRRGCSHRKPGPFARGYPDVVLDVTTTSEIRLDPVASHFDAGIHLGEFIEAT